MRKHIIILALLAIIPFYLHAQKTKNVKTEVVPVIEESPQQQLYKNLLSASAKVMFIDSVVVDKADFLREVPLNAESGNIVSYDDFFGTNDNPSSSVYINEIGNRCFFAMKDANGGSKLFYADRLGEKWGTPQALEGIGEEFLDANFPFVMADGITLYFAAKGKNSIGGYDIFMTLFDSESGKFYTPENFGMPYNSKANDYLIAFDDLDSLGWLVSDRYQPEGKVCIYTFEPRFPRVGFENDNISQQTQENFARLTSISDTWKFGNRWQAVKRLRAMIERNSQKKADAGISFVVNDQKTIRSLNDFLSPENREKFTKLQELRQTLTKNTQAIERQRIEFHNADAEKRSEMYSDMLTSEKEQNQLRREIKNLEKEIRNREIKLMNN